MEQKNIRNFCIIAHIDHGKSTLADRLLEITGTVEARKMKKQILDTMELEQERGITIKLQPARMKYRAKNGSEYELNLIDTPGHVDFSYEVSRSLAAVEGALLLVDATQGVQAQTIANLCLAVEQGLSIIPILNKIDLPNVDIERRREELMRLVGCLPQEIILASAKTGVGVPEILERIITDVPAPAGGENKPFRALVFDSKYDDYKGVIAYVRVFDGSLKKNQRLHLMASGALGEALDLGYLTPSYVSTQDLSAGSIGFVVTGLKDIASVRVGDTFAAFETWTQTDPLPGYKKVVPMVYAGVYPKEGSEYNRLRDAIEKVRLNDAALSCEPEQSTALGFGFRCGLLGMLHLEIVQERLRREHNMEAVVTMPSVAYEVWLTNGEQKIITSPLAFPEASRLKEAREPWVSVDIVCPAENMGGIMQLARERRGEFKATDYFDPTRAVLHYNLPLASVIVDFYDKLKSLTSGYGSMNYDLIGSRPAAIVRLDILVADEKVPALAQLVHEAEAYGRGREIVDALKETLPRQQFVLKLQAAVGSKVLAAEHLSAYRKDVLAKMSGGDYTRKSKLLQKQKKGKARMMAHGRGRVDIPADTFIKVLKRG